MFAKLSSCSCGLCLLDWLFLNPEKGRHEIKPTIKFSFKGCGQHITQTGHPSPNTIIIRFRSDSSRAHARAEPTTCRTASIRKLCRDKHSNTHTHMSERRNVYDKNCPAKGAEGESITGLNRTHMLALDGSADGRSWACRCDGALYSLRRISPPSSDGAPQTNRVITNSFTSTRTRPTRSECTKWWANICQCRLLTCETAPPSSKPSQNHCDSDQIMIYFATKKYTHRCRGLGVIKIYTYKPVCNLHVTAGRVAMPVNGCSLC